MSSSARCRAFGAVLTQSTILAVVPAPADGPHESAFAVMATVLQIVMSFALGWLGEHASLHIGLPRLGIDLRRWRSLRRCARDPL